MTQAAQSCGAGRPATEHTVPQWQTAQRSAPDCAASVMTTSSYACIGL